MRPDKFTHKATEALQQAQALANESGQTEITPEHLLMALVTQEEGIVPPLLQALGITAQTVRQRAADAIARLPRVAGARQMPSLGRPLHTAIDLAEKEADRLHDDYTSTEHLLLGIARQRDSEAARLLASMGATEEAILQALTSVRGSQRVTDQNPEDKYQALKRYARDLTEAAQQGRLDPVIGRDEEIRRIMQVLSRKTKNNPVLIGDPGVGDRKSVV